METTASMLVNVLAGAWNITAQMAPYLLMGFLIAGILYVLVPASWIVRHLGHRAWSASVKSALFGVPLPLCSCGVIPVMTHIRRSGAGPGATAAFLMSTPQTGVDSILVTYGLLGPVFAVIRPIVAFISGTLCGWAVDAWGRAPTQHAEKAEEVRDAAPSRPAWLRALRHGFVVLPRDVHRALLLGLVIAGVLGALMPPDYFASRIPSGVWGSLGVMFLMMLLGIPLYVCSTASVPIGLSLLVAGIPPGAVLAFLITGPATNAATITTLARMLGVRSAVIYLACLAASALAAGLLVDAIHPEITLAAVQHCAHDMAPSLFHNISAVVLLGIMLWPMGVALVRKLTAPKSPVRR